MIVLNRIMESISNYYFMKLKLTIFICLAFIGISVSAKTQTAFKNNSDSAGFYLSKAQESRNARKIWDAEKFYKKALEFNSNEEEIRLEFAQYYVEQRKYALALQQYNIIVEKNPQQKVAIVKQIELSFNMRKWADVIKFGEAAQVKNIVVEKLNYMIGKSYYEDENYGKARKFLTVQFKETPTHRETITLLGAVYVEMSMYNDAIAMYQKAIESNPKDFELMYEVGLLYSAQHNEREAVKYFEMAAANGIKQDLAFLENLGMAYLSFDIPKGVEVLNKVLEKKPGDVEILNQIAQAYYRAGDYMVAHQLFFKMFENDNKNVKALYMSGVALIRSGDKTKGSQICDRAIAMDPKLGELKSQKSIL